MCILILLVLNLFYLTSTTNFTVFSTYVTIDPYYHFTMNIILTLIPPDETFQLNISYLASSSDQTSALTSIYTDNLVNDIHNKVYDIWNYESTTQTVYIEILSNYSVNTRTKILTISKISINSLFTAVIGKTITSGYMYRCYHAGFLSICSIIISSRYSC